MTDEQLSTILGGQDKIKDLINSQASAISNKTSDVRNELIQAKQEILSALKNSAVEVGNVVHAEIQSGLSTYMTQLSEIATSLEVIGGRVDAVNNSLNSVRNDMLSLKESFSSDLSKVSRQFEQVVNDMSTNLTVIKAETQKLIDTASVRLTTLAQVVSELYKYTVEGLQLKDSLGAQISTASYLKQTYAALAKNMNIAASKLSQCYSSITEILPVAQAAIEYITALKNGEQSTLNKVLSVSKIAKNIASAADSGVSTADDAVSLYQRTHQDFVFKEGS